MDDLFAPVDWVEQKKNFSSEEPSLDSDKFNSLGFDSSKDYTPLRERAMDFTVDAGRATMGAFSGIAYNLSNLILPEFDREEWKAESAFNEWESQRDQMVAEGKTEEFFSRRAELLQTLRDTQDISGFDWKSYNPANPLSIISATPVLREMVRSKQEDLRENRDFFREDLGPIGQGVSSGFESMAGLVGGSIGMPIYIYGMTRAQYEEQLVKLEESDRLTEDVYKRATRNSIFSGAAEFASQYLTLGTFKVANKFVAPIAKNLKISAPAAGEIVKRAGLQALTRTVIGAIPEYIEESITEGIQGALQRDTERLAEGDADSEFKFIDAYNETAKFYEDPESALTLASSVILMQGLGGAIYNKQNHQEAVKEITAQFMEEELVKEGTSREEANRTATSWKESRSATPFINQAEFIAFKSALGTDTITLEEVTSKGMKMTDLLILPEDTRGQIMAEFKSGETSPTYERWKRLNGENSTPQSRVDTDARSPVQLELAPDWYTDELRNDGYQGQQVDIDISHNINRAVYHNSVQSGDESFQDWLLRKKKVESKSRDLMVDPENLAVQARTRFFPDGSDEIVQPPERLAGQYLQQLPQNMEKAPNLKEAITIFKSEMQDQFPELVEVLDEIQGPEVNVALKDKSFVAQDKFKTNRKGEVQQIGVTAESFSRDMAEFAQDFVGQVVRAANNHTFNRLDSTPEMRQFFSRNGQIFSEVRKNAGKGLNAQINSLKEEGVPLQQSFLSAFLTDQSLQESAKEDLGIENYYSLISSLTKDLVPILESMQVHHRDPLVNLALANLVGLTQTEGVLFQEGVNENEGQVRIDKYGNNIVNGQLILSDDSNSPLILMHGTRSNFKASEVDPSKFQTGKYGRGLGLTIESNVATQHSRRGFEEDGESKVLKFYVSNDAKVGRYENPNKFEEKINRTIEQSKALVEKHGDLFKNESMYPTTRESVIAKLEKQYDAIEIGNKDKRKRVDVVKNHDGSDSYVSWVEENTIPNAYEFVVYNPDILIDVQQNDKRKLFQEANAKVELGPAGNFDLTFFESANISSIFHEFSHIFLQNMPHRTKRKFAKLYGYDKVPEFNGNNWEQFHEQFARDFEQYILEGVSPSYELRESMYSASEAMLNAYEGFKKVPGSNLKASVQKAMDNLISTRKQRLEMQIRLNVDSPDQWEYERNVEEYKMRYMFPEILEEYKKQNRPYPELVADLIQRLKGKNSEEFSAMPLDKVPETILEEWTEKLLEADYKTIKKVYGDLRSDYVRKRRATALTKFRETQKRLRKNKRTIANEEIRNMVDFIMEGIDTKLSKKQANESLRKAMREIRSFDTAFQTFENLLETRGRAVSELSTEELISIERELTSLLNFEEAKLQDRKLQDYENMAELMDAVRNQLSEIAKDRGLENKFVWQDRETKRKRWPGKLVMDQLKAETIVDSVIKAGPGTPLYEVLFGAVDRGVTKQDNYTHEAEQILSKLAGTFFDEASSFSRGTSPMELLMSKINEPRGKEIEFTFTHPDNPSKFKTVGLTRAEIISIFMLAHDPNSRRSLLEGGIILGDKKVDRSAIRMTEQDLENILNSIGDEESYVASVLKEYYDFEYRNRNETFYNMNGLYLERSGEIYFPRDVDRGQRGEARALNESMYTNSFLSQYNRNLENQGFLKGRKTHRRPLIIRDAFTRTVESMQETGKYVGLVEPYRNMRAVLFDAEHEVSTEQPGVTELEAASFISEGTETVKKQGAMNQINEYFGPEVYQALLSYYESVFEGQAPLTGTEAFFEAMRQRMVVSILGLNARVAVKQASSLTFYSPYVDTNILTQASISPWTMDRMSEVSPQMRERFKIGGGHRDLAENYKQHHTRTLLMGGPKVSRGEFVRGFSMIRRMDALAVGIAFRAAELEGLQGQDLVDRAEWLVRHTQPNFHVKDRSSLQRQKGPFSKLITTFGSFTTMITNQMYYQARNGDTASRAKFIGALVANSAMVAVVDTAFDYLFGLGEEDETKGEELMSNFWESLQSTTIGAPFLIGDAIQAILSIRKGEMINNPTDLLFRPLEQSTRALIDIMEDPEGEDVQILAESLAMLLGIPLKNVLDWIMLPATVGEED